MPGDSKTEKATPKKRKDERKKGNIFLSRDIVTVVSLLGIFFSLKLLFPGIISSLNTFVVKYLNYAADKSGMSDELAASIVIDFVVVFAKVTAPLLFISVIISIVPTVAQTKLLFSTDSLKPKFSRLNPLEGFKKLFSIRSLVDVIKGIIKITILFVIIYNFFVGKLYEFPKTLYMDIKSSSILVLNDIMQLVINVSIAFVAISAFDYLYQWWDYERQMKMSKQEIKEEYKQLEGDPQVKGKIKELQRKMAMSRMMQQVPGADVVVRNPTHYAVALKYDINKDNAPRLVAKGQDEVALRIVKEAEKYGVYVVENKPLARAIYATTDLNGEIPEEFYGTIAELLVYVYKLRNENVL